MNVIQMRQDKRKAQISQIQESIQNILKEEKELVKKELVLGVMSECNLSKRTANDYLEVVLFNEGLKL